MLIKQDFSNLLFKEIALLEESTLLIQEEIKARTSLSKNVFKTFPSDFEAQFKWEIESVQNKRAIVSLENELKSKNEFLYKLKEKQVHDEPIIEEDFIEAINNFEDSKGRIKELKDLHDQARCNYLASEIELWMGKETLPEYKEAVGFYYRALKMSLRDSGIAV